jgi:anti-sigma B factor antagonist
MSLEYDVSLAANHATVALRGRIDRDAVASLDAAYRTASAAGADSVVLDFTDVDYINSTGIALIVGLLGAARADGCAVLAAGLTPHYQHIFDITRLSDFITIIDPVDSRRLP